jgi:tRNA dimethylallyltransferase
MSSSDASGAGERALRVICGPTAAGKSAIALRLAERHGGAIVSADSRQLYRGFDIGTAKPLPHEQACVPHCGVDVADPTERWSAALWAEHARKWVADAEREGRIPLIVGGTGFYISALATPLADAPILDDARRASLACVLEKLSTAELRRWTQELDPPRAHLGRAQLLRAVETALLSGRRLSDSYASQGSRESGKPARLLYLVVDPGRERLRERIARRVDAMLDAGWLDEVRVLMETVPHDAPAWNATGYAALRDHLERRMSLEAAREKVIVDTRRYAKRQRTWFRHQLPEADTTRLDPCDPGADELVAAWWSATPE